MSDVPNSGRLFAPEVVTHPDGTISVISAQASESITRSIKALRNQADQDSQRAEMGASLRLAIPTRRTALRYSRLEPPVNPLFVIVEQDLAALYA